MLKIKEYVKAESLEQAYELNQKKTNLHTTEQDRERSHKN